MASIYLIFCFCLYEQKSLTAMIIGLLLFVAHGFNFLSADQSLLSHVINILFIVGPYLYTTGAYRNLKSE